MLERIGLGIDIVMIDRFKKKPFKDNENFYKKIFHDSEIKYCQNHKNSSQFFAAKFAIKESVIKSIPEKIDFLEILTDHSDSKPVVSLLNNKSYIFLVSVSHELHNAVAVVVSEKSV
jgi:holo-[acyl-carrier protein] synthase